MGQCGSPSCMPAILSSHKTPRCLVSMEEMSRKCGNLPIRSRYVTERTLESDFIDQDQVIGVGMHGSVRLVQDRHGKQYAVKSFKKKMGRDAESNQDLKNEVEIYLALDHPQIARLERVYEERDAIHLVMEYVAGGEVSDRLANRHRYTEQAAADTMHSILSVVAYLHAHHICHRDLKLENFLYEGDDSDHVKLIDFGLAASCPEQDQMTEVCGTLPYVAPEVLATAYTNRADLWSIGVISHMLLTGHPVFRGEESDEMVASIRAGDIDWAPRFNDLSRCARNFVSSLLELQPAKRLTAQAALAHPFIVNRHKSEATCEVRMLAGLQNYAHATHFRRACLSIMAWSLPSEARHDLDQKFAELDVEKRGRISLHHFKEALEDNDHAAGMEVEMLFGALDTNNDNEISYSEFVAAMLPDRVRSREDVLQNAFSRFDHRNIGAITVANIHQVLGDRFYNFNAEELIREAGADQRGHLFYKEFSEYLQHAEVNQPAYLDSKMDPSVKLWEKQCEFATIVSDKICLVEASEGEALQHMYLRKQRTVEPRSTSRI